MPIPTPPSAAVVPTAEPGSPSVVTPSAAPLTPVPGDASGSPAEPGTGGSTTVTDWGRILDVVPDGFPVYPGAEATEPFDGPASGTWLTGENVETVAAWFVSTFEELGWSSVDLGSALEDGTRVLDLASDLPECRVQTTFRPADGSTMISVLYGAGCAGGDG